MTTLREAAQQALEALEKITAFPKNFWDLEEEITALRAALAQPLPDPVDEYRKGFIAGQIDMRDRPEEQEPMAWQWLNTAHFRKKLPANAESGAWNPLYAHPPRREWQSLTDEEINAVAAELGYAQLTPREVARAVEQALKEKNHE